MERLEKKKILLINALPCTVDAGSIKNNMPAGILAVGSWITKNSNFGVKLVDCVVEKDYLKIIKRELESGEVFLVGLSVMTFCIPNALEITRLVKDFNSEIKVIWGGIHPRLYPEQTIEYPLIDFIACNEGEKPLLNLANCLANKRSYKKVKGIMYKEKGEIVKTPKEEFIDLNELGLLDYSLLNPCVFDSKVISVYTSRGCPHRCTFCINNITRETTWRSLTPENVIKEIEFLYKNHGTKVIYLGDATFFVSKERTEKIADMLIKKNFKLNFCGNIRANYFTNGLVTQELLNKMKKAGFFRILFSPEFGTQKMRDFIKKDINENDILTGARMTKEAGITSVYGFMTGFPNETKEDTLATIKLAKKLCNLNKGLVVIKENNKIIDWNEKSRIAGTETYRHYAGGKV